METMETHEGCVLRFYVECVTGTECFHQIMKGRKGTTGH